MTAAHLRLARPEDGAALAQIYAPYVNATAISFEVTPPTAEDMARRVAAVQVHAPFLVCESAGTAVGYAYLSRHHERAAYQWSVDSAVYVASAWRRRGLGRALYTALFALGRLQGFRAVHAGITLPNAASVGLHESLGFTRVAQYPKVGYKLGAWHDVAWWQLELGARLAEPEPVLSPDQAHAEHAREWNAALAAGQALLAETD
jgi:phosphinothricin acetyltransferase